MEIQVPQCVIRAGQSAKHYRERANEIKDLKNKHATEIKDLQNELTELAHQLAVVQNRLT